MAQVQANPQESTRCAHAGCKCAATPEAPFCSPYCDKESHVQNAGALLGEQPHARCQCGHPGCG